MTRRRSTTDVTFVFLYRSVKPAAFVLRGIGRVVMSDPSTLSVYTLHRSHGLLSSHYVLDDQKQIKVQTHSKEKKPRK